MYAPNTPPQPEYWVLSLSGGKDSTALGLEWLKRHQQDPITYPLHEVIYCDTGMEFPAMVEHINRLEQIFTGAGIENARGYDAKDDRMSGNPNQMNIQSMYSDIDLDANGMETEFQAAFEQLLWFINQDMKTKGEGDFENEEVTVIFNRDILINESEAIANCASSVGILSNETIVGQHPWTTDVKKELERLQKEKQEAVDEYAGAFGNVPKNNDPEGGEE